MAPRSFLDAGKVVPVGSEGLNYVYIGQYEQPAALLQPVAGPGDVRDPLDPRFVTGASPAYGPFGY